MRYRDLRWPCDHPVTLLRGDRGLSGRIINISNGGARALLEEPVAQRDRLMLNLTGLPLTGEVRWVRGKLVGLKFDRLLTPRETAVVRKTDMARQSRKGWNLQLREMG